MPTSITALLILLLAVLPGGAADAIFRRIAGEGRRPDLALLVLRMLGFSAVGFFFYAAIGYGLGLPYPAYVQPSTFSAPIAWPALFELGFAYLAHFSGALLVGFLGGFAMRYLPVAGYPSTWDGFIQDHRTDRWLVVKLKTGERYLGELRRAEATVARHDERDLVLSTPALYGEDLEGYAVLPYREIFLSGEQVHSIAVVENRDPSERDLAPGGLVYLGEDDAEEDEEQ